jgi:hypothetical protein
MYDESKIIEKTASAIRSVELNDVSEVIHDIHCQLEAVELLDMTKYKMVTTSTAGLYNVGFDISNLVEGQEYIFSSNLPLATRVKIGAYAPSYSSVLIEGDDVTEASFTMTRNPNIAITETQYLFVFVSEHWVRDMSELEGYKLSIQLADANPQNRTITVGDKEYITDENGVAVVKSAGPIMNIATASSWKINLSYWQSAAYDIFWDSYQNNGGRKDYQYAFAGEGWNDTNVQLKYPLTDITISNSYMMFARTKIVDVAALFPKLVCAYSQYTFYNSLYTKHIGEMTIKDDAYGVFSNCQALEKIDKLVITNKAKFTSAFNNCYALKDIVMDGSIENSVNFQWSPLSVDSMKSIISRLQNFSGTTDANKKTITFSDACWAALEASGPYPTGGTWEDYVTSLGWNV